MAAQPHISPLCGLGLCLVHFRSLAPSTVPGVKEVLRSCEWIVLTITQLPSRPKPHPDLPCLPQTQLIPPPGNDSLPTTNSSDLPKSARGLLAAASSVLLAVWLMLPRRHIVHTLKQQTAKLPSGVKSGSRNMCTPSRGSDFHVVG